MASGGQSSGKQGSGPWSGQQGFLTDIYNRAQGQSYDPRTFFGQSTVVPFSSETEQGYGAMADRARGGSPNVQAAQSQNYDTLQGRYLDPSSNPWLQSTYESAARPVQRALQTSAIPGASMSAYGRGGSGAEANRMDRTMDAGGRAMTDLATGIYGGNYGQERQNQMQAQQMAPQLANYDYQDIGQLLGVGKGREELASRNLQDLMERFNFQEDEPRDRLREYAGLIGSPVTSSSGRQKASNWGVLG